MDFVGPFPQALEIFVPLVERWSSLQADVNRLAFGAVLHSRVESLEMGYKKLGELLPSVQLDSEGSSEFFYQINRPRESKSGIARLRINRLSKWSVAVRTRGVLMGRMISDEQTVNWESSGQPMVSCRLELDINTSPEYETALPAQHIRSVFRELVDLAVEVAEKGDLP
jgi:hypothetical protein